MSQGNKRSAHSKYNRPQHGEATRISKKDNTLIADVVSRAKARAHKEAEASKAEHLQSEKDQLQSVISTEQKVNPMRKELIDSYISSLKNLYPKYFEDHYNVNVAVFEEGSLLQFVNSEISNKDNEVVNSASFPDACRTFSLNLRDFLNPDQISLLETDPFPFSGTNIFLDENKIYIIKQNQEDLYNKSSVKDDLKRIAKKLVQIAH